MALTIKIETTSHTLVAIHGFAKAPLCPAFVSVAIDATATDQNGCYAGRYCASVTPSPEQLREMAKALAEAADWFEEELRK